MILASGYTILPRLKLLESARPIVNGPILPKYMRIVIRNFPGGVKWGVIPVESPTVPKAETVSKRSS